ncbi:hypothetical protein OPT61_g3122 [Boeremia exigua]|uniref:Uncharacterized protein n=1 Tax=Boeremia exigua TaxID=749465 RepID=A0ACC2IJ62_9PLEO|nr:hypothetical protein OPT61_g3122 [Boeremia exigua]
MRGSYGSSSRACQLQNGALIHDDRGQSDANTLSNIVEDVLHQLNFFEDLFRYKRYAEVTEEYREEIVGLRPVFTSVQTSESSHRVAQDSGTQRESQKAEALTATETQRVEDLMNPILGKKSSEDTQPSPEET